MAASTLLIVSATLALLGNASEENPKTTALIARGWFVSDRKIACGNLTHDAYYIIENENSAIEALYVGESKAIISRQTLPEAPYSCREIPSPQFIEEIL